MEPAEFKNQVWALMRDITDRMNGVFHPIIDRYGLTIMQMRVLFEIRREDGCTVSGLSRRVCAAGTNVSALCKRLEREGLLERSRDPRDERVVHITLTGEGRRTVDEVDALGHPRLPAAERGGRRGDPRRHAEASASCSRSAIPFKRTPDRKG